MQDLVFMAVCILHSTNCFYFSSFVLVFTLWSHYWNGRDKIQQNKDVFSRILYSSVLCCCLYYRGEDVMSKDHLMMLLNMAAAVVPCVLSLCVYFTVSTLLFDSQVSISLVTHSLCWTVSGQVKVHIVLTCTNGVSPSHLPVMVASNRP